MDVLGPDEVQSFLKDIYREFYPNLEMVPSFLLSTPSTWPRSTFRQMMHWVSHIAFSEKILLPPEQHHVRALARELQAPIIEVEDLKKTFERFDVDNSGDLNLNEFQALLQHLLKAPRGIEVPHARVMFFWRQMSGSNNDGVIFEDFLDWHRTHFKTDESEWYTNYR